MVGSHPAANLIEEFETWCSPRLGRENPEDLTNDVWSWLIEQNLSGYEAHQVLGTKMKNKKSPCWSFNRFGQAEVELANGSKVFIAGEHEDHYDEDFFIYNDVVVQTPDNKLTIYCYPEDVFPPTDFHSATVMGDEVYIVGCLGHPESRKLGEVPIYVLDTNTYSIKCLESHGTKPDWLHDHRAELSKDGDALLIEGGKVLHKSENYIIDNIDSWRFCLKSGEWHQLTNKNWRRWILVRETEELNELFEIGQLAWAEDYGGKDNFAESISDKMAKRGHKPDLELFKKRYFPPVKHTALPADEDDFRIHRFMIDDVSLKYVENSHAVYATVEGKLPEKTVSKIMNAGCQNLSSLEGVPYKIIEL